MDILSIDLGTSSTVAVLSAFDRGPRVIEVDGSVTMSSAVFAGDDGSLVVGEDAERRARLDPARFEANPKRRIDEQDLLLGTDVVPVVDALAAVLRRIADEAQRQLAGKRPDEVRLAHPAGWGGPRVSVLREAAGRAGLGTDPVLIPEPVAAAAHYAALTSQPLRPGGALAVYDLGAGTFDCAVVGVTPTGFRVLAENGLPDLGSLDVDQALLVHIGREVSHSDPAQWQRLLRPDGVADRRMRRLLLKDVQAAKETLSRHTQTDVPMPEPFGDVLVTRAELEALVRPSLLRSAELLATTVRQAGLAPGQLAGIYLVGGPSRMPLVGTLIAEQVGVVPTSRDQPETVVAFGLHHVPVSGSATEQQATGPRSQPVSAQTPAEAQAQQPTTFLRPVSGPVPTPAPAAAQQWQHPGYAQQTQQARRRSPALPWLLGAGGVVLVAILVITLVVVTGGDDESSTKPLAGQTPTSSAPRPLNCDVVRDKDEHGFTRCLRVLADDVPSMAQCTPGVGDMMNSSFRAGAAVTCSLPSQGMSRKSVTYFQGVPYAALKKGAKVVVGSAEQPLQGSWRGGGVSGKYMSVTSSVLGVLVFGLNGDKASGMLIAFGEGLTPKKLAVYFTNKIKPD